jgi:hypothetical protein
MNNNDDKNFQQKIFNEDYKFEYSYYDNLDNVISVDFNKEKISNPKYYYDFGFEPIETEEAKVQVTVGISHSFLEKLETQLARVFLTLDNLLDFLHKKK